jgi:hypothetical protein
MADDYVVERSKVIRGPAEAVYAEIVDFHRWTVWSPWEGIDPDLQRTYSGPDAGVGATFAWSGNRRAGEGTMEITEVVDNSKIVIDLYFLKPFKSHSTTEFHLNPEGESTRVTWTMTGPMTLMTRIMGVFKSMDKMIGPDFEKGLRRLKSIVETNA